MGSDASEALGGGGAKTNTEEGDGADGLAFGGTNAKGEGDDGDGTVSAGGANANTAPGKGGESSCGCANGTGESDGVAWKDNGDDVEPPTERGADDALGGGGEKLKAATGLAARAGEVREAVVADGDFDTGELCDV